MKNWYLIKTKPRQEKIAVLNLKNQNYHVYCPMALIDNKNVALFPGYLFIHLDEKTEDLSPIRSTKGVSSFVKFGLSFAKISDGIIDFIKSNENLTSEKIKNINNFKPGEAVQISDGIFKNCLAIFQSIQSDERVILLLKIMGQQQSINIKRKSIIPL